MNTKLQLISALAAGLALQGAAMPTEAEVEKAVPKVERMLASEKFALASGKMPRAEVAAAAMKLAAGIRRPVPRFAKGGFGCPTTTLGSTLNSSSR